MRILVVRYRFIGDTILTVPFLRNLRRCYPYAKIDMLVAPVSGELLETCPYVDNLIYFDTTRKHRYECGSKKKSFWHYVKLLRSEKYDKAYVLKRSFSSAALCAFAGIKSRVGFNTEGRGFLLTKRVPYDRNKHEVESFLEVLKADNVPVFDDYLELWLNKSDMKVADELFERSAKPDCKRIIVHATSGNPKKQWKPEYFAKVIEKLSNEKNMQVFHLGARSDKAIYEEIRAMIKTPLNIEPVNLCGQLALGESAAFIAKMDMVFGNDSGTLHVAGALDVPTVVIYGPMDYKKWRVWNDNTRALSTKLDCYPCNLRTKCINDYACLNQITPEIAINFIDEMFANKSFY